jgi:hypothetical protein
MVFHNIIRTQLKLMWKIQMSKELLLQHQKHVNPLQIEEEDKNKTIIHNNIEQEIECPRCHDVMGLSSGFDRLSYVCQECNLSLLLY